MEDIDEKLFEKYPNAMDSILEEINKAMINALQTGNTDKFSITDILTNEYEVTIVMGLDMDSITIKKEQVSEEDISIVKKIIKFISELPPFQIPKTVKQVGITPDNLEEIAEALKEDIAISNIPEKEKKETISSIEKLSGKARGLFGNIAKSMTEYLEKKRIEKEQAAKQKQAKALALEKEKKFIPVIPENIKKTITTNSIANIVYAVYIPAQGISQESIDIVTLESLKNNTQDLIGVRSLISGKVVNYKSDIKRVHLYIGEKNVDTHVFDILRLFDARPSGTEIIKPLTTLEEIQITGGPFNFTFNNIICKNKPLFDNLEIIETIGDGTCLVHSFLQSTSELYRQLDRSIKKLVAKVYRLGIVSQLVAKSNHISKNRLLTEVLDTSIFLSDEIYEILANHYKYNYVLFTETSSVNSLIPLYKADMDASNPNRNKYLMFYNKDPIHFASIAKKVGDNYYFDIEISDEAASRIDLEPIDKCTSNFSKMQQVTYEGNTYSIYKLGLKGDLSNCAISECNAAILVSNDSTGRSVLKLKDGKIDIVLLSDLNRTGEETPAPVVADPFSLEEILKEYEEETPEKESVVAPAPTDTGLIIPPQEKILPGPFLGNINSKNKNNKNKIEIPAISKPLNIIPPIGPSKTFDEELAELEETPVIIPAATKPSSEEKLSEKELVEEEAKLAQYNVEQTTKAISTIGKKVSFAPVKPLNPTKFKQEYVQLRKKYMGLRDKASQQYGKTSEQYKSFNTFISKLNSINLAFTAQNSKDTTKHKKQEEMEQLFLKLKPKK
jgi:hypothetical protein